MIEKARLITPSFFLNDVELTSTLFNRDDKIKDMKNINVYQKQLETLKGIFGTPTKRVRGRIFTKLKTTQIGTCFPMVKVGFFGKWKYLKWTFFDEQPEVGYTKKRAQSSYCPDYPQSRERAQQLIDDFKRYRGSGITIW